MENFRAFVDNCLARISKVHFYQVGIIEEEIVAFLENKNIEVVSNEIYYIAYKILKNV